MERFSLEQQQLNSVEHVGNLGAAEARAAEGGWVAGHEGEQAPYVYEGGIEWTGGNPVIETGEKEELGLGGAEMAPGKQQSILSERLAEFNAAKARGDEPEMQRIFAEIKQIRDLEQSLKNMTPQ